MLTIFYFSGLPGSGKSTEAERVVLESNCGIVRVNKDCIRSMAHGGKYSKGNEEMVLTIRDAIIGYALEAGKHVIVDDTNFEPKHRERIEEIASAMRVLGKEIRVVDRFFDTPLDECIARDIKRANGVGEKVIRSMYNKYLKPKDPEWVPAKQDPDLPHCIIVDIDGTIAKMKDRGPFEWAKVGQDEPYEDIIRLAREVGTKAGRSIVFMSGRDEVCRAETVHWLRSHIDPISEFCLHMRPAGNNEKDTIIKERLYREHVEGKYHVDFVLDDRDQVVALWRSLGLRCLQVSEGNF